MDTLIDVIFIAGSGRSGSTLLDRVLGTLPNASSYNELRAIPKRGLGENQRCACGNSFRICEFWSRVIKISEIDNDSASTLIEQQLTVDRLSAFLKIFLGIGGKKFKHNLEQYQNQLSRLYHAIAAVSGRPVLIDSTKIATHALILSGIPGVRLHILHLVRDARDVASAWKKRKYDPGTGEPMRYMSPLFVSFSWLVENLFAGMLKHRAPYHRVRYEDFISNPQHVLDEICDNIEPLRGSSVKLTNGNIADLGIVHAISGNPDRFSTGPTIIRMSAPSRQWLEYLPRAMATLIGLPLLFRYGYLRILGRTRASMPRP